MCMSGKVGSRRFVHFVKSLLSVVPDLLVICFAIGAGYYSIFRVRFMRFRVCYSAHRSMAEDSALSFP